MNILQKSKNNRKREYQPSVISIALVLCVAVIGVMGFIKFYDSYIDQTLYAERLSQMREVTTQLFSGLEEVVENQWNRAADSCRRLQSEQLQDMDDFLEFMEKEAYLDDFESSQSEFVAVDQNGKYYTQTGGKGLLQERSYLSDEPEQISFVSNSLTYDESRMFFLKKLSEPCVLQNNGETISLIYYGISQSMDELNPYFDCTAYNGNNSVYVVDEEGLKLFSSSNGSEEMLKGFNAYHVLQNLKYLHGSSFDDARQELDQNNIAYSNALLDQREIYYSLYRMDNAAWTLLFLVPSEYVAMNTVKLVNMTMRLVLIFAITLVVICVIAIFLLMRKQQQIALEAEKKNNEVLEKMNVELKAASQAKSDFLANMSHDIRTPMNAIVGITGLMEHEEGLSDKMHTYIEKVQLSSKHLLGLINDILDMSRIESNEVKLNTEHVSLAEQIGQIDSMIRAQANEHHQKFHIHVTEIVHEYLICDGVRFRQIILNLLSNAVKYTPQGGDVILDFEEIACEKPDHARFHIAVTDNGYGMTPEFVAHIFEPFTRAENSMTNKVQGTGLGMAITKNIVDMMNGEIHVESKIGQGSRFDVTLTLPIDREKNCTIDADRILLVTDEQRLIRNMKASMCEAPVEFHAVETEEEAAGWLAQVETDVVLLSGCVRNKTLRETVDLLRQTAKNATLIFCVDYVQGESEQEGIAKSGVDGIVYRPFFLSNLEMTIARTKTNSVSEHENKSILKGMKFLCAEDNALNAEILKEILHMYDAECTIYSNGEEIVQAFQDVKPGEYDAILMDVQMPKMNGLEATRAIRRGSNPLGEKIPIIAMTANAFSEDVQQCIGAGMDAHIAKPLDIALLEKTLREIFAGGQIMRKIEKMF